MILMQVQQTRLGGSRSPEHIKTPVEPLGVYMIECLQDPHSFKTSTLGFSVCSFNNFSKTTASISAQKACSTSIFFGRFEKWTETLKFYQNCPVSPITLEVQTCFVPLLLSISDFNSMDSFEKLASPASSLATLHHSTPAQIPGPRIITNPMLSKLLGTLLGKMVH